MRAATLLGTLVVAVGCVAGTDRGADAGVDPTLGEDLVRQLWRDIKTGDAATIDRWLAPGFQSAHEDGARTRQQEIDLLKKLNLGDYTLSGFRSTQDGPAIVVTYLVTVTETIDGKRLSKAPAPRLTVFLKTAKGWQWLAHANLHPLKQ